MEKNIKIKALGISSEMEMNLDTIKDGLARNAIEYADEIQKILKCPFIKGIKAKKINLTICGKNNYRIFIGKDYNNGKYKIFAVNFEALDEDVYERATDFKVLSGINANKMMQYMLEAIVACGNDANREADETAQETAEPVAETTEAFDPYRFSYVSPWDGSEYYIVTWLFLEYGCTERELSYAFFPTKEMAEQFAALLKSAGYKEVKIEEKK